MQKRHLSVVAAAALAWGSVAHGTDFMLLGGDPAVLYSYPGPATAGTLNDGADVHGVAPTFVIGSDPNYLGAWSYVAGEQPFGIPDVATLPQDAAGVEANLISFGVGTVSIDDGVLGAGGGPLVTGWSLAGTAYGQGIGPTTLSVTAVNGGTYTTATGALTLDVDLEAGFFGGALTVPVSGLVLSGASVVQNSLAATGNAYVDGVVIPKATAVGASGVMFIDMTGTLPANPPFVPVPVEVRFLLVGVSGVMPASLVDLSVTKSAAPAGVQAPGNNVVYTLTVNNAGPAAASGVTVVDRLPAAVSWVSDTCATGGPDGDGLLTWTIGALAVATPTMCAVTLNIAANANFDFDNAAIAFSDQLDSELADNIAEETVMLADNGNEGIGQPFDPTPGTLFPADLTCWYCLTGVQTLGDNFKVNSFAQFGQLVFYGGYTDNVPAPDSFTARIYTDTQRSPGIPGVPGVLVADISGPVTRSGPVGLQGGALSVYEYRMPIGLSLPRGSYWLVLANDVPASDKDWVWSVALDDAAGRSRPTSVYGTTAPGDNYRWGPSESLSFAFTLLAVEGATDIPALGIGGLALLASLLGGLVWTRRRRACAPNG